MTPDINSLNIGSSNDSPSFSHTNHTQQDPVPSTWEDRRRCVVYKADNAGGADVWLHAVDVDTGENMVFKLVGHRPYFYCKEERAQSLQHPSIVDIEFGHESITEEPLAKITTEVPGDVRKLRKLVEEPHEADVPYVKRACIDARSWGVCDIAYIDHNNSNHQGKDYLETRPDWIDQVKRTPDQDIDTVYFDIEGGNIFDIENARDEVYCIGLYDPKKDDWRLWSYHPNDNVSIEECETNKRGTVPVHHEHFIDTHNQSGEREMLSAFLSWLRDRKPMAIAGWNSGRGGFDLPYLINRARRLGISDREWGRHGHVDWDWLNIPGVHSLDLLKILEVALYGGFQDNSLKNVAEIFCDITLHKNPNDIKEWWLNDQEDLFRYNIKDVEATYEIDAAQDFSGFAKALSFLTYTTDLESVELATIMLDGLFLLRAQERGVALPMRKSGEDWQSGGAYVIPPQAGLHENVAGFDVSSLYPSITVGCNISYETVADESGEDTFTIGYDPNAGDRHDEGYYGRLEQEEEIEHLHFDQTEEGLIPQVAKELWKLKKEYGEKKVEADTKEAQQKYDTLYSASKIALNSASYGVGNSNKFRLGRIEVGEAITAMGRTLTKAMARQAEEVDHTVTHGDTDAAYVKLEWDDFEKEAEYLIEEMEGAMQHEAAKRGARQPDLFELEWEMLANPMLCTPKKKLYAYRMTWEDGKKLDEPERKVKGLYMVRSDASDYTAKVMGQALDGVLMEGWSPERLFKYINDRYVDVRQGNVPHYKVASRKQIKRDLMTYKEQGGSWTYYVAEAANAANEWLDKNFVAGSRPYALRLKEKPDGYDANYIALEEGDEVPEGFEIDWAHHADNAVKDKLVRIFQAVGYDGREDGLGMRSLDSY